MISLVRRQAFKKVLVNTTTSGSSIVTTISTPTMDIEDLHTKAVAEGQIHYIDPSSGTYLYSRYVNIM